jgi:hypothetical protein
MVTTGVTGSRWRATITPWGGLEPWDGEPLDWYVAADDRWHVPATEAAVRQRRVAGTPVTETRVRVPNGDVVQRIYSVVDAGGVTVVEIENESTLPVAVAFDRRGVLTERPVGDVPIEGIDLPDTAFVLPLGHRATVRIGVPHGGTGGGRLPARLPTATQVVRGWTTLTERASRLVLPDGERGSALAERITAERSELALGAVPHPVDDPVACCLALGELVRMGERAEHWLPELVDAVAAVGREPGWDGDVALAAADRVLAAGEERRARRDLARILAGRMAAPPPTAVPDGLRVVPWIERLMCTDGALLPAGLPSAWLGQPVEVHGVPTVGAATVSFAIRWHGVRPAVLWEQSGGPVELTSPALAPGWCSAAPTGEALWPAPPGHDAVHHRADGVPAGPEGRADDPVSFS